MRQLLYNVKKILHRWRRFWFGVNDERKEKLEDKQSDATIYAAVEHNGEHCTVDKETAGGSGHSTGSLSDARRSESTDRLWYGQTHGTSIYDELQESNTVTLDAQTVGPDDEPHFVIDEEQLRELSNEGNNDS